MCSPATTEILFFFSGVSRTKVRRSALGFPSFSRSRCVCSSSVTTPSSNLSRMSGKITAERPLLAFSAHCLIRSVPLGKYFLSRSGVPLNATACPATMIAPMLALSIYQKMNLANNTVIFVLCQLLVGVRELGRCRDPPARKLRRKRAVLVALQFMRHIMPPNSFQGLSLNLADSFTSNTKFFTYFF